MALVALGNSRAPAKFTVFIKDKQGLSVQGIQGTETKTSATRPARPLSCNSSDLTIATTNPASELGSNLGPNAAKLGPKPCTTT